MTTPTQDTSNTGEGAESPEELEPQAQETRRCIACGTALSDTTVNTSGECDRCYVWRKC